MALATYYPGQEYWPLDILEAIQTRKIKNKDLKCILLYSLQKKPGKFYITIHHKLFATSKAALWARENKTKNQRLWIPPSLYI